MKQVSQRLALLSVLSVMLTGCFILAAFTPAHADAVAVYPEFSGVVVSRGETVRMDLILENKGNSDETIDIKIPNIPKGWKAQLKGASYLVTGMYVPAGKTKTLALELEPDKSVGVGTYVFQFDSGTSDGKLIASQKLTVEVQERTAGADDIIITVAYPILRGQIDPSMRFEYSIDVLNKSESERTLNLTALVPENWEVNFKPGYESKQITSLRLKGGQNQSVAIDVAPVRDIRPGSYPLLIRVSSGDKKAEAKLTLILTGNYQLDAGTPSGILSLSAMPGKPSTTSLYVKNTGTAVNQNIYFSPYKPENWEVTFKPEKIDVLEPGADKLVEMTIKPSPQAVVGDYSVGVIVNGERTNKTVEFRVTVKASTAWGWIGVGIIIFVIAGLVGLFIWLGRR